MNRERPRLRRFARDRRLDRSGLERGDPPTSRGLRARRTWRARQSERLVEFDLEVGYSEGFTGSVMHGMAKIPCGETRTYGEIAAALDTAPVAVGGACGRNPGPADRALSPRRRGGLAGWVLRRRGSRTRVEAPPPRSRTRAGRERMRTRGSGGATAGTERSRSSREPIAPLRARPSTRSHPLPARRARRDRRPR